MGAKELEVLPVSEQVGRLFVFADPDRDPGETRRTCNAVAVWSSQDSSTGCTEEVDGIFLPVRCVHGREGWRSGSAIGGLLGSSKGGS